MKNIKYKVIIIGSGPGGYVAAEESIKKGFSTLLIEKSKLGGVCLNYGCIPTKALLYSSELFYNAKQTFSEHGISCQDLKIDISKMVQRSKAVVQKLSSGLNAVLSKVDKVYSEVIHIDGKNRIIKCADGTEYEAEYIVIATGAKHRDINIQGWSYKEALEPKSIPKSLAIIGSGAIGMEFACFYSSIGSKVTVYEMQDRILPFEDHDISKMAEEIFTKRGINFIKNTTVKQSDLHSYETTLIAAGIVPNIPNIEVQTNKYGGIDIDQYCRTNIRNIYAIGDVTNVPPSLAHKASRQAMIVIDHIDNKKIIYTNLDIPSCTYTYPQVASIGFRECDKQHHRIVKYYFSSNGLSVAKGKEYGFIKFLLNTEKEIIGCHMIGDGVSEIIQQIVLARSFEITIDEIADLVHPHPTLSESILEISKKEKNHIHLEGVEPPTS